MTLCPIARAIGCTKCPALSVCPLKGTLGDFRKDASALPAAVSGSKQPPVAKDR